MKRSFVFLFLLLACGLMSAQTTDCASLTDKALELSGFNQTIDQMTEMISSDEFMQQMRGRQTSDEFLEIFKPILDKEFNGDLLRRELQGRVAARCNMEQMSQAVQRLQSPFVARMLTLEAAVNTPEGQKKLKRYINIARTVPPTDDRMDALDALDDSSGSSDFAAESTIAILRGMMTGAGAPPEIMAQIQAHRKDIKLQMQNTIELSMSITYHGVTRPELHEYAKELAAEPLKGFYTQVKKAFVEIMEERSRAMGQDLKKAMTPRPPTT
jgi:negative regulator of replication initiation